MTHIGLMGCGKIGRRHLEAYSSFPDCKVTIFDVASQLAEQQVKRFGVKRATNMDELLSINSIDAIDVCIPTTFHKEVVIAALNSGKHVFCEKPLCATAMEATEINLARQKANRIVMVGYIYRFAPIFQFIKKVLDDNIIGRPYFSIMRIGGRGSHAAWKHQISSQGGARLEKSVHLLDLAYWFFGEITEAQTLWESVQFQERIINGQMVTTSAEDLTVMRARTNEVEILFEADMASSTYMNYIDIQGENGSIFGSAISDLPLIVYCRTKRGSYTQGANLFTFPQTNFLYSELRHFLSLIRGEVANGYHSVDDSLILLNVLELSKKQIC